MKEADIVPRTYVQGRPTFSAAHQAVGRAAKNGDTSHFLQECDSSHSAGCLGAQTRNPLFRTIDSVVRGSKAALAHSITLVRWPLFESTEAGPGGFNRFF